MENGNTVNEASQTDGLTLQLFPQQPNASPSSLEVPNQPDGLTLQLLPQHPNASFSLEGPNQPDPYQGIKRNIKPAVRDGLTLQLLPQQPNASSLPEETNQPGIKRNIKPAVPDGLTLQLRPQQPNASSSLEVPNQPADPPSFGGSGTLEDVVWGSSNRVQDKPSDLQQLCLEFNRMTRLFNENAMNSSKGQKEALTKLGYTSLVGTTAAHNSYWQTLCSLIENQPSSSEPMSQTSARNLWTQLSKLAPFLHQIGSVDANALIQGPAVPNDSTQPGTSSLMQLLATISMNPDHYFSFSLDTIPPDKQSFTSELNDISDSLNEIDKHSAQTLNPIRQSLARLLVSTSSMLVKVACTSHVLNRLLLDQLLDHHSPKLDAEAFDLMMTSSVLTLQTQLSKVVNFLGGLALTQADYLSQQQPDMVNIETSSLEGTSAKDSSNRAGKRSRKNATETSSENTAELSFSAWKNL